jgi:tetratricopeptide (TPR) repeat protein
MNQRIEKILAFLKETPEDNFLNHALALEYVKEGNEAEAEKCFMKNLANNEGYVATYYHLGKLLERIGKRDEAVSIYEKGMIQAKNAKDMHSYSELQNAHEDLVY